MRTGRDTGGPAGARMLAGCKSVPPSPSPLAGLSLALYTAPPLPWEVGAADSLTLICPSLGGFLGSSCPTVKHC